MSGTPNEILATIWRSMTILTGTIYIIVLWHITTNKTGQDINTKTKINMIIKNCQKLSKLSKIVKKKFKIVKKFQNCQICQKIVKIVKMLVRSCFLITVIKYLKGHWSLGSLFNVKKQKVGHSVSESVTRSPIELSGDS